ncbi:hypothetical protein [Halolamina rubra]|uniref:hypothetical protein n=1 Tax=Halolamina rubra TaxID=1380430 RepID=UPI0012AB3650|nr:hypothetical protein [Halolamina rubra]
MTDEESNKECSINRRTILKSTGAASGAAFVGASFSGVGAAQGHGGPCHKDFECDEGGTYVKFEFVIETDEDGNTTDCYFEEETDTGLVEITDWDSKDGEECEPVSVEWEADGYVATTVMAFGGNDCDTVGDPGTGYTSGLENNGGNTAAISNLQFCLEETPFPECPFYGTSREDPTSIVSISYDPDADEITETVVGDIPDDFDNSNYPNGLAFDDDNDVWYFAEENGVLKTMNEDGALGIETYGVITPGDEPVAGATFHDGLYYYIPNGGDELWTADISSGSVSSSTFAGLNWSDIGLGDLAVDEDEMLYVSTTSSNIGSIFFSVDLNDTSDQQLIVQDNAGSTEFATGKQLAFENDTLWAHAAGGGQWYTVDLTDGTLSDPVATTREYTDLASCGEAEWEVEE